MTSPLDTSQAAARRSPGVRVSIGGSPATPELLAAYLKPRLASYDKAQKQLVAIANQTLKSLPALDSGYLTHATAKKIETQMRHLAQIRAAASALASTPTARQARRLARSRKPLAQARNASTRGLSLTSYRAEGTLLGAYVARQDSRETNRLLLHALQAGEKAREAFGLSSHFPVTKPAHAPPLGRSRVSYALGLPGVAAA